MCRLFDALWDGLSAAEALGAETSKVMLFTVVTCLLHYLLYTIRLHHYVPTALVLANPYILERFFRDPASTKRPSSSSSTSSAASAAARPQGGGNAARALAPGGAPMPSAPPSYNDRIAPNLPVRIAESLLGRTPSLLVLLPAHLIGAIMGLTFVQLLLGVNCTAMEPYIADALLPLVGAGKAGDSIFWLTGWWAFFKEMLVTACFVLGFLVCPELLAINRLPAHYACVGLLPLLLVHVPDQTAAFAPAQMFAIWFTNRARLRQLHVVATHEHGTYAPFLSFVATFVFRTMPNLTPPPPSLYTHSLAPSWAASWPG